MPLSLNNLFLFFGLFLVLGCTKKSSIILNNKSFKVKTPPGTIQIDANFFADETEVRNIDYREFYYWMERVYGVESEEFLSIKPNKKVWKNITEDNYESYFVTYFDHPAYSDYPVVGLTLEQAKKYTKWRTERVVEQMLIERKWIDFLINQNKDNHFTLERYQSGKYDSILVHKSLLIPVYDIPTEEEWKFLAKGNTSFEFGIDKEKLSRKEKKELDSSKFIINSKETKYESYSIARYIKAPFISDSFTPNLFGLYNVFGNVSEMIDQEGFSKGGSWNHTIAESDIEVLNKFTEPNAWTGFRNVCRWEKLEISN